jgi:hypothetical protein
MRVVNLFEEIEVWSPGVKFLERDKVADAIMAELNAPIEMGYPAMVTYDAKGENLLDSSSVGVSQ